MNALSFAFCPGAEVVAAQSQAVTDARMLPWPDVDTFDANAKNYGIHQKRLVL